MIMRADQSTIPAKSRLLVRAGQAQKVLAGIRRSVTAAGASAIILCISCVILTIFFGWLEALCVATALAFLTVFALPFLVGDTRYKVSLKINKNRAFAGQQIRGWFFVKNAGVRRARSAQIEIAVGDAILRYSVPALGINQTAELPLRLDNLKRGVIDIGPFRIVRQDPLRFFIREITISLREKIFVCPKIVGLKLGAAGQIADLEGVSSAQPVDSDFAFHAIREYQSGDQPRHLDWRATARTGKLQVRQFTQTQSAKTLLVLDTTDASYADKNDFELAVSAAASICAAVISAGHLSLLTLSGGAATQAYAEIPGGSVSVMLETMAAVKTCQVADLRATLFRAAKRRERFSRVIIVTGSTPTPELGGLLAAVRSTVSASAHTTVIKAAAHAETVAVRLRGALAVEIGELSDLPMKIGCQR